MTRASAALLLLGACATGGNEAPFPALVQSSGVGPFRQLDRAETGTPLAPDGQVVLERGKAIESGMVAGGHLFYVAMEQVADPPDPPPADLPEHTIDLSLFAPRRILRSPARPADLGFDPGTPVLEAAADWEGDAVFDPWVVVDVSGRAHLYYAAAGGIGLAEAPSVTGAFVRVGDGPVLAPDPAFAGGGTPRRPSVIVHEGRFLMYWSAAGGLGVATSTDGVTFRHELHLGAPGGRMGDDPPTAVEHRHPGAAVAVTPAHRTVVRVYFEALLSDGTRALGLGASHDGLAFELAPEPVFQPDDPAFPAPLVEDGVTRLYFTVDNATRRGVQLRALVAGVSPSTVRFAEAPEEE